VISWIVAFVQEKQTIHEDTRNNTKLETIQNSLRQISWLH